MTSFTRTATGSKCDAASLVAEEWPCVDKYLKFKGLDNVMTSVGQVT